MPAMSPTACKLRSALANQIKYDPTNTEAVAGLRRDFQFEMLFDRTRRMLAAEPAPTGEQVERLRQLVS
jgi:hypothetical protein